MVGDPTMREDAPGPLLIAGAPIAGLFTTIGIEVKLFNAQLATPSVGEATASDTADKGIAITTREGLPIVSEPIEIPNAEVYDVTSELGMPMVGEPIEIDVGVRASF